MAKPIKETPILTGRDATNLFQQMKESRRKKVKKPFSTGQTVSNGTIPGKPVFTGHTAKD